MVYMVLIAAMFQAVGWDSLVTRVYLIVVYYWAFRLLYVIFLGHVTLLNWVTQVIYWISSIGLALWAYSLLDKVGTILPSPESLLEQLWLLIIMFLYSIFNKIDISRGSTLRRKERYLAKRYASFKGRYGEIINELLQSDFLKAVTYSIMIYENFNRSKFVRILERLLARFSKKKHTYGIMQVTCNHALSDEESVRLGISKILADVSDLIKNPDPELSTWWDTFWVSLVANRYNGGDMDYYSEVVDVYQFIKKEYYPGIPGVLKMVDLR